MSARAFIITAIEHNETKFGSKFGTESRRIDVGTYETWICAGCGYAEWYAVDDERLLERLAAIPDSGVRLVDSRRGPYR